MYMLYVCFRLLYVFVFKASSVPPISEAKSVNIIEKPMLASVNPDVSWVSKNGGNGRWLV